MGNPAIYFFVTRFANLHTGGLLGIVLTLILTVI